MNKNAQSLQQYLIIMIPNVQNCSALPFPESLDNVKAHRHQFWAVGPGYLPWEYVGCNTIRIVARRATPRQYVG